MRKPRQILLLRQNSAHVRAQIFRPSPNFSRDPVRATSATLCGGVLKSKHHYLHEQQHCDHHHDQPKENMNMESGGVLESTAPLLSRDEREGVAPGNDFLSF